jgi:hypothetical protein
LADNSDPLPERLAGVLPGINPVDTDAPAVDVVEPGNESGERRLAGPGFAGQPDGFAALDRQRYVGEHRLTITVAKGHVRKVDLAADICGLVGISRIVDRRGLSEQPKHPFGTRFCLLVFVS